MDRRHLVTFRWLSDDSSRAIAGGLGMVLPDGEWLDPEAALRDLGVSFTASLEGSAPQWRVSAAAL